MDTTPEYIKMCEKATEIQALAKSLPMHENNGEYVCTYEGTKSFCPKCGSWVHQDYCGWCGKKKKEEDAVFLSYRNSVPQPIEEFGYIWLPRQDQLQEILKYQLGGMIMLFHEWIEKSVFPDNTHDSMEQLWLAFVMKELHNKVWNGEEWVNK